MQHDIVMTALILSGLVIAYQWFKFIIVLVAVVGIWAAVLINNATPDHHKRVETTQE